MWDAANGGGGWWWRWLIAKYNVIITYNFFYFRCREIMSFNVVWLVEVPAVVAVKKGGRRGCIGWWNGARWSQADFRSPNRHWPLLKPASPLSCSLQSAALVCQWPQWVWMTKGRVCVKGAVGLDRWVHEVQSHGVCSFLSSLEEGWGEWDTCTLAHMNIWHTGDAFKYDQVIIFHSFRTVIVDPYVIVQSIF